MSNNNSEIEKVCEMAKMVVETHEPYVKYMTMSRRSCMIALAASLLGVVYPLFSFLQGVNLAPIVWYLMGLNTCLVVLNARRVHKYDGELALANYYLDRSKKLLETHKEANHDH